MLEEFKNTLPLLLLENPYKPINQLGDEYGWNNPQSWGLDDPQSWDGRDAFLETATAWQAHLGNEGMQFTLKLLEAIELPNPDDILLPETGFRMWEGTHPVRPMQDIQYDKATLPVAIHLIQQWASVWQTVDTPGRTYVSTYVEQSQWQFAASHIGPLIGKSIDPNSVIWCSSARNCLSATSGAYFATMFPNIPGFDKYACVRTLFHLGFFPAIDDNNILRLHVGDEAEIVWEGTHTQ
jgi:hypothetical protein